MSEDKVKLPRSSYEELCKIIKAYGRLANPASLDEVSQLCAMNKTAISANNAFLVYIQLVEGGQAKTATAKGKELAKALEHELPDQIEAGWTCVVQENDFLSKMAAAVKIRGKMEGSALEAHIDKQNVLDNLITAYQRAAVAPQDPRALIVHAGNAVESFLSQLAGHRAVNVQNAHGINAEADALANAGHLLSKHKFMVKYLGHVRNAADHGIDAEIGTQWDVSPNTAVEFVHVAQSVISAIVSHVNNRFSV